jgi:hypothetical protein
MEVAFSKFVELLKSSPRIYAALTVAGICVVFPFKWQHLVGLDRLREHYLPWASLSLIVFAVLLIMALYDIAANKIRIRNGQKRAEAEALQYEEQARRSMEASIRALSPEERLTIACFVASGQQTLDLSILDDSVDRLLQRGMIVRFQGFSGGAFRAAHGIDQSLFEFLDKNKSLIASEWRELERRASRGEPCF